MSLCGAAPRYPFGPLILPMGRLSALEEPPLSVNRFHPHPIYTGRELWVLTEAVLIEGVNSVSKIDTTINLRVS